MTAKRRNPPMSTAEMRAHAAAAGECPHCDLMWRGFVAATADADQLREELAEARRERAGMQRLAQKNRERWVAHRDQLERLENELRALDAASALAHEDGETDG